MLQKLHIFGIFLQWWQLIRYEFGVFMTVVSIDCQSTALLLENIILIISQQYGNNENIIGNCTHVFTKYIPKRLVHVPIVNSFFQIIGYRCV